MRVAHINLQQFDRANMRKLLVDFPLQFQHARQIGASLNFEIDRTAIKNLLFAGMGGSAIGGDLIGSCLSDQLPVPAMVIRNYVLPAFVDRHSLVIVSSYSGNTEEALSCSEVARSRKATIVAIASGGKLAAWAQAHGVPLISIPGGAPPRTALGYLTVPLLVWLANAGLVRLAEHDFEQTQQLLERNNRRYASDADDNPALKLANQLRNKFPIIYCSADLLWPVAWRWKGQFSENSKVLAFCNVFPELNHNETVGWQQLPERLRDFQIIYLRDRDDHPRNQKRMEITRGILERVCAPIIELYAEGESRLARLFSLVQLGDWVSYYLAVLSGIDPTPIEKIQHLKDQLSRE